MYDQIENYFVDEDMLDALLEVYKPKFKMVEDYWDSLQKGEIVGYEAIDDTLQKVTGLFMEFNLVATIADTELDKQEGKLGLSIKANQSKDKKLTEQAVNREVSVAVHSFRRVRNLFRAYRDNCNSSKENCQSRIKVYTGKRETEN